MKVTLEVILKEEDYAPVPGTEYDVGTVVTLKRPTFELRDAFVKKYGEVLSGEGDDRDLARMISEGEWPEKGQEDPAVVSRLCEDFFCAARPTWRKQSPLRQALLDSISIASQSKQDGPSNGEKETADGPS
jgi:hypothetical protein